jgi:hypothetical protein
LIVDGSFPRRSGLGRETEISTGKDVPPEALAGRKKAQLEDIDLLPEVSAEEPVARKGGPREAGLLKQERGTTEVD